MDEAEDNISSTRSSSASTSDPEPSSVSSIVSDSSQNMQHKYRDSLDTDHFVNKIARFELLSGHQQFPPTCGNNMQNGSSTNNSNGGSNNNYSRCNYEAHPVPKKGGVLISKPNVNFNRSDQGFGFNHYSHHNNGNGFGEGDLPFGNGNKNGTITKQQMDVEGPSPSPASLFLTDFSEQDEESSGFLNHYEDESTSVPSPDSLSSISNHNAARTFIPSQNGESRCSSRSSGASQLRYQSQKESPDQASIACETLLQIKRKQVWPFCVKLS